MIFLNLVFILLIINSFILQQNKNNSNLYLINSFFFLFSVFCFCINSEFFLFSVFGGGFVVCGLPQAFGLRNDEGAKGSIHKLVIARAWKARGNLSMGYNYLFMEFFFFSVFALTISGLWGFASLCKGGSCEATGGLREKLKIKNWKLIHKKLKIENWKLIFHLKLIL